MIITRHMMRVCLHVLLNCVCYYPCSCSFLNYSYSAAVLLSYLDPPSTILPITTRLNTMQDHGCGAYAKAFSAMLSYTSVLRLMYHNVKNMEKGESILRYMYTCVCI